MAVFVCASYSVVSFTYVMGAPMGFGVALDTMSLSHTPTPAPTRTHEYKITTAMDVVTIS